MTQPEGHTKTSDSDQEILTGVLTAIDLYTLAGEVLVTGGYADGDPEYLEVRDPKSFRRVAERLREVLLAWDIEVEDGEIPLLQHDPDGVPGKYVWVA